MTKLNKILVGAVVVQAALALVVFLGQPSAGMDLPTPILTGFDKAAVTEIQLFADGDSETPAVTMVKEGDSWTLSSHHGYPPKQEMIDTLLSSAEDMTARGAFASSAARHKQMAVDDAGFKRLVVLKAGDAETRFYVGAAAGARRTAVRIHGKDEVLAAIGMSSSSLPSKVNQWIDTKYFKVEAKDLARVTVERPGGSATFEADGDNWTLVGLPAAPEGKVVDDNKLKSVARRPSGVTMVEPADPSPPGALVATVVLTMKPAEGEAPQPGVSPVAQEFILDIAEAADDRYWVRERSNPFAALVNRSTLKDIVELSHDVFYKDPEPETPQQPAGAPGGMPPGMQLPPGTRLPPGTQLPPGMAPPR